MISDMDKAVERIATETLCLMHLIDVARDVQWLPSPHPPRAGDTRRRRATPTGPTDPTGNTAVDPARLVVRDALTSLAPKLDAVAERVTALRKRLDGIITAWEGIL